MIESFLTALAVLLRIFSNPLANVYQKQLTNNGHPPLLVNFLTYLILAIICIIVMVFLPSPVLHSDFWLYSILGGIAGAVGNGFLVKALQKGDLSILGPINSYKSVVGIIVGIFLLGEIPNGWGLLGIAIIIAGSYLVLDTTEEKFSAALLKKPEIQFRIWAMILTAIEAVFVKKVIIDSDVTMAFAGWCVWGAIFSLVIMVLNNKIFSDRVNKDNQTVINTRNKVSQLATHNPQLFSFSMQRFPLVKYALLVLCIGTMQLTTNYVFAHMPVGYALSLFQLSTLVSVFFGYRFFKERDIMKKIIGSVIMIVGSIIIILLKN